MPSKKKYTIEKGTKLILRILNLFWKRIFGSVLCNPLVNYKKRSDGILVEEFPQYTTRRVPSVHY